MTTTQQWSKAKEISERNLLCNARPVKRTMTSSTSASPPPHPDTTSVSQTDGHSESINHSETIYWLKLELDTTRQAKKAVEDRMAKLYRDIQDFQELTTTPKQSSSRPPITGHEHIEQQQKQIAKYERVLRVMNNQIALLRSSSDSIVKNLKNEISELMDEKVSMEVDLMNKLSAVDLEKRQLEMKLEDAGKNNYKNSRSDTNKSQRRGAPQPPQRHKSIEDDDETGTLLRDDLMRLRVENARLEKELVLQKGPQNVPSAALGELEDSVQQLKEVNQRLDTELTDERQKSRDQLIKWTVEKSSMEEEIAACLTQIETNGCSAERHSDKDRKEQPEIDVLTSLDRVGLLWDKVDESTRRLDSRIIELRSNHLGGGEEVISFLDTTSLVHDQIKVSLMLIELQLRNRIGCSQIEDCGSIKCVSESEDDNPLAYHLKMIRDEAMDAIVGVESLVVAKMEDLKEKAGEETATLRECHETATADLQRMVMHQEHLEEELAALQHQTGEGEGQAEPSVLEMFVSQKALETLQNEVLLVVERVKEKNETIGRQSAEIEEYKVRERTLMEELKRHMKDQASRQLLEQQEIMQRNAQLEDSDDASTGSQSCEYDEKTIEETVYDEVTLYDEETVL